jgi:RNA polymerase sigma-70 factor (ECF subfamily)
MIRISGSHDSRVKKILQQNPRDRSDLGQLLDLYRGYLTVLARKQLQGVLKRRMNPSDLVQDTLLQAYRDFGGFRGQSEGELVVWLRTILIHCIHREYDKQVAAGRRDVRREVSLEQVVAGRGVDCLAPVIDLGRRSEIVASHEDERAAALMRELGKLRSSDRQVLILRHLEGLSFAEIAKRLKRRPGAVRMRWLRALSALRRACGLDGPNKPR